MNPVNVCWDPQIEERLCHIDRECENATDLWDCRIRSPENAFIECAPLTWRILGTATSPPRHGETMPRTVESQPGTQQFFVDPHFSTNPSNIVAAMESAAGGIRLSDGTTSRTHCVITLRQ